MVIVWIRTADGSCDDDSSGYGKTWINFGKLEVTGFCNGLSVAYTRGKKEMSENLYVSDL